MNNLTIRIAEIRDLTSKKKLPWLYTGDWQPVFKQIDLFLSDLTRYRNILEKKADQMHIFREEKNTMDLNKCSKGISIYKLFLRQTDFLRP